MHFLFPRYRLHQPTNAFYLTQEYTLQTACEQTSLLEEILCQFGQLGYLL